MVSIHAPREGCDTDAMRGNNTFFSFNSRTPGGVRLVMVIMAYALVMFQFTHPGRGATDLDFLPSLPDLGFNSRTPGGVRQSLTYFYAFTDFVSIHAPREGCDCMVQSCLLWGG